MGQWSTVTRWSITLGLSIVMRQMGIVVGQWSIAIIPLLWYYDGTMEDCDGTVEHCDATVEHCLGTVEHYLGTEEHYLGTEEYCLGTVEHCLGTEEHYNETMEHCKGAKTWVELDSPCDNTVECCNESGEQSIVMGQWSTMIIVKR